MEENRRAAVELRDLTLTYPGARPLLQHFHLTVAEGETLAITGESGLGKSSVLRCICGLIPGSIKAELSGEVLLLGRPLADYSRVELVQTVGVVFQNPDTQLFCDTVEDELAFGLENLLVPVEEMRQRIAQVLELIGLQAHRHTSPNQLSGGQKQLVVLGAVLAMRPAILLLDEALSQLDREAADRMLGVLRQLSQRGQTMVMVDHEPRHLALAHRAVELEVRNGI